MKLWGGRFSKSESLSANAFNASIGFDRLLYRQDIRGSQAHAAMLARQGIIAEAEAEAIITALGGILADIDAGVIEFSEEHEDIHMNIEVILTQRLGDVGKKLHTARSRNDQVALDLRMYLKDEIDAIAEGVERLNATLLTLARAHRDTIMPGYTHLQRAQPVTFAFHLLAYQQMFTRDLDRLGDCRRRTDAMPLGSGALAGVPYANDREFLAKELGFASVCANAMDAVSDRDFAVEFLSVCSIMMLHLSRFCEELILWSTAEFGFIEIDDAFATGSSIMPQKKNPDMAELIRGKTGRVYGSLMALLTVMKGLPLAYNKDMQEDKEPVFDTAATVRSAIGIFTEMLATMHVRTDAMAAAARKGCMNATDAADYLVAKAVPFRDCHAIIGRIVLYCADSGRGIEELSLEELRRFSEHFNEDVYDRISIEQCIAAKKSKGSTAPESVDEMIRAAEKA